MFEHLKTVERNDVQEIYFCTLEYITEIHGKNDFLEA